MDLKGHMDALELSDRKLAEASGLSMATVRMAKAGRTLGKQAVDRLLDALSKKYGRKIEREEVEGLLLDEA
ncbi:hypothetical protein KSC_105880 [Ktedonobacter sp. SOSP1-52]|uniref:hypothetical protein n=1 Tax=Ktedonobacter sp. SOSP1-52 TaxID=2778366 RepID=UPI001915BD20|nr:hypothetical protein [Ktedonobacter sp. SOSP1-52]GHO71696.1 hypothetical protein KSC_105880 [Ktedonobacter sp. SOSP1-52]